MYKLYFCRPTLTGQLPRPPMFMTTNQLSIHFFQTNNLRGSSYYAAHALVPGHGFIVFGGIAVPMVYTQQLTNLTATWQFGPNLFNDEPNNRQCAVQVTSFYRRSSCRGSHGSGLKARTKKYGLYKTWLRH